MWFLLGRVIALVLSASVSVLLVVGLQARLADAQSKSAEQTQQVDGQKKVRSAKRGTWNSGQAALWDLDLIDHYRIFGFPERAKGYKPPQPIKFSHKLHAGELEINCQFCHWSVHKDSFAALPEVQVCMGCHENLVNTERTRNSQEITKLKEYAQKGEPIPWNKVHVMPDHVRFNHKRHVKAGVACHECHGVVSEMEEVERASSMKMGWCVSCHRAKGTSIDCWTCHR